MARNKRKKKLTLVEKITITIVSLIALAVFGFSSSVFLGGSTSVGTTPLDSLTLNAGAVDNATHDIDIAVVRFAQSVKRLGVATTTLSPSGTIFSNTISPQANFDVVSQDSALPHIIRFRGTLYRQVPSKDSSPASLLDGPPKEIWSTDMTGYSQKIAEYFNLANPGLLLQDYRDLWRVKSVKTGKDGSEMIGLSMKESDIPNALKIKYPFDLSETTASSSIWFYVTLSKSKDINRILIVPSSNKVSMVSYDGLATKVVDKPDLTLVLPTVHKAKAKR